MNTRVPSPWRPTIEFAATIVAVLVWFRVLDIIIARLGQLPAPAYSESVFLDNVVAHWWNLIVTRVPVTGALGAIGVFVVVLAVDDRWLKGIARGRVVALFKGWSELDDGKALRWLLVGVTGVATWALSCYARNLYFDQLHLTDRLILVALWIAIAWRPIFVLPFAIAATAIAGQFVVPLGFISWTEMGVVLRFPVLFGAFWILRAVTGKRATDPFIFAWCCLVAATYWTSGLGKLTVGWFSHPHLNLLLLGAYANGWLADTDPRVIESLARVVGSLAVPLMLFTLLVECGSLLMLWTRWSLVGFFVLATAFHLGAFAMTGIFFWKWILVDAMLLVYLFRGARLERLKIFRLHLLVVSVVAIIASPLWAPSENLTWFDTPLTYTLVYEGVDERGDTHQLPAGFFRPYTEAIVLGPAGATPPHPKLTRGMGVAMDRSMADMLEGARSTEAVFAIEQSRGTLREDSTATRAFDAFLRAYATNGRCPSERDPLLLRVIGVPRHLWTFPLDAWLPCTIRLERIRVIERTMFFDGTTLREIRRLPLREVPAGRRVRN